jgi:nitroreductase
MTATGELSCDELLSTTRNVRLGLDLTSDVDLELVKDCLRLALQAPNGANRQHWRWIVLTDADRRARLAEIYRRAFYARNGARLDTADEATRRMMASAQALAENLARVPVLVIPCLQLDREHLPAGNQASTWGSLLPAAWSYMLAARSRGLATAWTTAHLDREREVAELIGLPPTVHQGGLIPTARSLRATFRPAKRRPLDDVLHLNGWQGEVR